MRRIAPLVVAGVLSLGVALPAHADDRGGCERQSCSEHGGHQGDNIHLERIGPVYICTTKDACPRDGQTQDVNPACLPIPIAHCDPPPGHTQSFFPPDPSKIASNIADFAKVIGDFVASVLKFAV